MQKVFLTLGFFLIVAGCDGNKASSARYASAPPVRILRFDKELFRALESGDTALLAGLSRQYPLMTDLIGKAVLNLRSPDAPGFSGRLMDFYSEPTLMELYRDAVTYFDDISGIEQQLGDGLAYLAGQLPALPVPEVYMHVSGFGQNVLAGEGTLSLSIDKYLGRDYPLYSRFFYGYQRQKMQPAHIVQDYLAGWLMSEYPFTGRENVLLDRMVYEGKIKYLVAQALPDTPPGQLMGYTEEGVRWAEGNESLVWKTVIERKHLYTPDYVTTSQYFEDRPSGFFPDAAPGNLGAYTGWRIVTRYMEETKATLQALMLQTDAQAILAASRYKP